MIPFSTAVWDPQWFHDYKSNDYCFFDKNGVCNGLRLEFLKPQNTECHGKPCEYEPANCAFLKKYLEQLNTIDFNIFRNYCESIAYDIQKIQGFTEEPIIVLLVYETSSNPCSERVMLKKWFNLNNSELVEYKKGKN